MSEAEPLHGAAGFREQYRLARHRAFLDTAIRIVVAEGQAALTMQRVADQPEPRARADRTALHR